jgi:hypothetical protein
MTGHGGRHVLLRYHPRGDYNMPVLKPVLVKIDEVDEKYRDLYTERNGKWEFTGVEGLKTQADIDRQLAANQKVRGDLTASQAALTAANAKLQVWGELDHDDVAAKLEKLATYEAGQNVPELMKNFETTVNARVQTVIEGKLKSETTKLQRTIEELNGKVQTLTATNESFVAKDNTRTVHDAIRAVAAEQKVLPEAMVDLLLIAGQELKLVDGKAQTEDGRDAGAWLEDAKAKRPYFWPVAQGTGAHGSKDLAPGGVNPFARKTHNVTAISQMVSQDATKAAKLADLAGVPKNADGSFKWHVMPPSDK